MTRESANDAQVPEWEKPEMLKLINKELAEAASLAEAEAERLREELHAVKVKLGKAMGAEHA